MVTDAIESCWAWGALGNVAPISYVDGKVNRFGVRQLFFETGLHVVQASLKLTM